jgi:hypothetical protein
MRYMSSSDPEYWENPAKIDAAYRESTSGLPDTVKGTFFTLGDDDDDDAPLVALLDLPPCVGLPRHTHNANLLMMVVKGSLYVPGRILLPGDCQQANAHEFYGPEVAGPQGCTRIEIWSRLPGGTAAQYEIAETGDVVEWSIMTGSSMPYRYSELEGHDLLKELTAMVVADAAGSDLP